MINGHIRFTVSVIDFGTSTDPKPIDLIDALDPIREGQWRMAIGDIREKYTKGGRGEDGKKAVARQKLQLPGILFSGTFTYRSKSCLIQHSGLICCDLDNLGNQTASIKEAVTHDPCVLAAFLSPTGEGLKVVLRCDPLRKHEEETYPAAHIYMLERFGVDIDGSCSDVSRICYVSDDPDIYIADHADCIPYPETIKPVQYEPPATVRGLNEAKRPGDDYNERGDIPSLLKSHGWTPVGKTGWRRPEKDFGLSATYGYYPGMFHVFTSSTQFEPNRTYMAYQVFAHLECRGDFSETARRLGALGYGQKKASLPSIPERISNPAPAEALQVVEESWDEEPTVPVHPLDLHRVRIASKPPEPVTRLFLANKPIATPGNLVTLISRAKTGKTATIGAAVAAIIAAHNDRPDIDSFGFTAPHTKEAVVLIDTEQSPYDAFTCHERALSRAQEKGDPDWLFHYAFVGKTAEQLAKDLLSILKLAKERAGGVFTVILDGVADFVESVNDEAECNNFVTWLRSLAVHYDCPIICVIHSNEAQKSGDDGRGHLGKQLTRKAESNLLLKKEGEITTITSEKQRKAPITDKDGIAFRWSDSAGRHVSCEARPTETVRGGKPKKYFLNSFIQIFPSSEQTAMGKHALLKFAQDISDIKETSFRELLNQGVQDGELKMVKRPVGFHYYLNLPGQT